MSERVGTGRHQGVPPGHDPATCLICHAPAPHPRSICIVCGRDHEHVSGTGTHLQLAHKIGPGRRAQALALDFSRAVVRGWPTDGPKQRFEEWMLRQQKGAQ
jgi:hypothetical protein